MTALFIICPTCKGSGRVNCPMSSCHVEINPDCEFCNGDQKICCKCSLAWEEGALPSCDTVLGPGIILNPLVDDRDLLMHSLHYLRRGMNL